MSKPKEEEMTPVEKMIADRAAAEAAEAANGGEEVRPSDQLTNAADIDGPLDAKGFSLFDERWNPPQRPFYDYEVVALVNRDCGQYAAIGLPLDSVEDVDSFVELRLEKYREYMTTYQAEYYRIMIAELLFKTVLTELIKQQRRAQQMDQGVYNQIAQEAQKPSRKRNRGNN